MLEEILPRNNVIDDFVVEHDFPDVGKKSMLLNARRLIQKEGKSESILLAIEDISDRKFTEKALPRSEEQYKALFNSMDQGYCVIEMLFREDGVPVDYRFLTVNSAFETQSGMRDVTGRRMRELAPDHEPEWFETFGNVAVSGKPVHFTRKARAWVDAGSKSMPFDSTGRIIGRSRSFSRTSP